MKKIIGLETTYHGEEHPYLRKCKVRIVAVLKDAELVEEHDYLTEDIAIEQAGGITKHDRLEVQPWIEEYGRYSFVTSDPLAIDLAYFADLSK